MAFTNRKPPVYKNEGYRHEKQTHRMSMTNILYRLFKQLLGGTETALKHRLSTATTSLRLTLVAAAVPVLVMFSSCYNPATDTPDAWDLTKKQIDSISFSTSHHYSQGYNFMVKRDSMRLVCEPPDELPFDSVTFQRGDRVVVADIMAMPGDSVDSVWVKIARDQITQGWVRECDLLAGVEPDDYISQFIDTFSNTHLLIFLSLFGVVSAIYGLRLLFKRKAHIVHFNDIGTFYPSLLALLVASSATLYSTIQLFAPEMWRHFYYHPTLNPFALPPSLGLFVSAVWAIVIVGLAALDEIRRKLPIGEALLYLCGLAAVCAVNYILFSISTLYYVGYPLLLVYAAFAIVRYRAGFPAQYVCGNCGERLSGKGVCPRCGAIND